VAVRGRCIEGGIAEGTVAGRWRADQWVAAAVLSGAVLFTGLMSTLIITAVFPVTLRLAAPVVCPARFGESVVTLRGSADDGARLYCVDEAGWALAPNALAVYATVLAIFVALLALAVLVVRLRRRRHLSRAAVAVLLVVGLTGCSWGTEHVLAFDERTSLVPALFQSGRAQEVVRALEDAIGGPVIARSFGLFDTHAVVEAQSSSRREHVNRYVYHRSGGVQHPEPLDVSDDQLEGTFFDLADLPLDELPRMVAEARAAAAHVEGGDVSHLLVRRDAGRPVVMTLSVRGLRGSATVTFSADGQLIEVR
jgi:hypothetical protein